MFQGGYMGKVLRVNLTTKKVSVEDLPEKIARDYIGGAGFGVKYLFDEVPGDVDSLGPDNKLIFAPGPLSGTPAPCASRMAVTTKSPLTGAVGMSLSGGYFPVELKFAGYDVLIIEGQADTPVYLHIRDDKVAIKNAEKLWGMDTQITQSIIKQDVNDHNTRIACIGQAGENLSKMAAIINERRAFGRKGVGAVMGSKNLKAIAIRGSGQVPLANPKAFETARKFMLEAMKQSPVLYPEFSKLGTPMVVDATSAMGIFPSENYRNTGEKDYSTTKWNQDIRCATTDCPTMCGFLMDMAVPAIAEQNTADLVSSASGIALTKEDVGMVGERVNNLARVFNISAGFTRADDTFPKRIMAETIKEGGSSGQRISQEDLNLMLDEYYEARNWRQDGVPTRQKLAELDLPEAAAVLVARGLL